ncbi:MAG: EAL domain-containing protein [Thermoleophilaceae bacterium]
MVLPLGLIAVVIAVAASVVATSGGRRAANKELDARGATVKKAWDAAGRPSRPADLKVLGRRLNAQLRLVPGRKPAPAKTAGDVRTYAFAAHGKRTLRVALPTKGSKDALSSGQIAGVIAGLAGVLLLIVLGSALLRALAIAPLRGLAGAIQRVQRGDHSARAPVKGAGEVRAVADAFNHVAARSAELDLAVGTDPVTGLPTSDRVVATLDVELKRAAREMVPMALVLVDMDNFKALNDAHGKQVGERVLRQVADRLRESLRATDVIGRSGGDEFAMILPKANADHCEMVIARGRGALGDVQVEGFAISFSAGYAVYPADARDAPTLMQAAEGALRAAQRQEAGGTRRFDPAEVSVKSTEGERHEVLALLQAPTGITPVFQPLVALATGQVSGYEALSRFQQPPNRRPDEWFLLAQRVGLGPALEARAIQAALTVQARPPGTYLSLNLSPSTLTAPEVQAVLPPDLNGLVIEITEHELAADDSILGTDLDALRARGARVAVDDAGAGYAGLQQLMRVAPDLIKLDRSLVQSVDSDPAKQALVDSFVRFGRRTGAQVVAEGIETEDELRTLADLDVSYGQGYFLSKPGPAWPSISPWISEKLLHRSLGGALSVEDITQLPPGSDQRLAAVCARIARVTTMAELESLRPVIAEEVGADEIVFFVRGFDGMLAATTPRPWLPSSGRLELAHFPAFESVLRRGEPEQILLERGSGTTTSMGELALLANSGYASMLAVPVGSQAMIQALAGAERPWGRAQTNRALVVAYQLAPVMAALTAHAPAA